jgi:hypothetical protein
MTMMVHKLVRLTGNEPWDELGDDWESQLDVVCNLSFVRGWSITPGSISRKRKERTLDWGARLYEVSKAELLGLLESRPESDTRQEDWDAQHTRLAELPEDGRYGVIWMECY